MKIQGQAKLNNLLETLSSRNNALLSALHLDADNNIPMFTQTIRNYQSQQSSKQNWLSNHASPTRYSDEKFAKRLQDQERNSDETRISDLTLMVQQQKQTIQSHLTQYKECQRVIKQQNELLITQSKEIDRSNQIRSAQKSQLKSLKQKLAHIYQQVKVLKSDNNIYKNQSQAQMISTTAWLQKMKEHFINILQINKTKEINQHSERVSQLEDQVGKLQRTIQTHQPKIKELESKHSKEVEQLKKLQISLQNDLHSAKHELQVSEVNNITILNKLSNSEAQYGKLKTITKSKLLKIQQKITSLKSQHQLQTIKKLFIQEKSKMESQKNLILEKVQRLSRTSQQDKMNIQSLLDQVNQLHGQIQEKESIIEGLTFKNQTRLSEIPQQQKLNQFDHFREQIQALRQIQTQIKDELQSQNNTQKVELMNLFYQSYQNNPHFQKLFEKIEKLQQDLQTTEQSLTQTKQQYQEELKQFYEQIEQAQEQIGKWEEQNAGLIFKIQQLEETLLLQQKQTEQLSEDKIIQQNEIINKAELITSLNEQLQQYTMEGSKSSQQQNNVENLHIDKSLQRLQFKSIKEGISNIRQGLEHLQDNCNERFEQQNSELAQLMNKIMEANNNLCLENINLKEQINKLNDIQEKDQINQELQSEYLSVIKLLKQDSDNRIILHKEELNSLKQDYSQIRPFIRTLISNLKKSKKDQELTQNQIQEYYSFIHQSVAHQFDTLLDQLYKKDEIIASQVNQLNDQSLKNNQIQELLQDQSILKSQLEHEKNQLQAEILNLKDQMILDAESHNALIQQLKSQNDNLQQQSQEQRSKARQIKQELICKLSELKLDISKQMDLKALKEYTSQSMEQINEKSVELLKQRVIKIKELEKSSEIQRNESSEIIKQQTETIAKIQQVNQQQKSAYKQTLGKVLIQIQQIKNISQQTVELNQLSEYSSKQIQILQEKVGLILNENNIQIEELKGQILKQKLKMKQIKQQFIAKVADLRSQASKQTDLTAFKSQTLDNIEQIQQKVAQLLQQQCGRFEELYKQSELFKNESTNKLTESAEALLKSHQVNKQQKLAFMKSLGSIQLQIKLLKNNSQETIPIDQLKEYSTQQINLLQQKVKSIIRQKESEVAEKVDYAQNLKLQDDELIEKLQHQKQLVSHLSEQTRILEEDKQQLNKIILQLNTDLKVQQDQNKRIIESIQTDLNKQLDIGQTQCTQIANYKKQLKSAKLKAQLIQGQIQQIRQVLVFTVRQQDLKSAEITFLDISSKLSKQINNLSNEVTQHQQIINQKTDQLSKQIQVNESNNQIIIELRAQNINDRAEIDTLKQSRLELQQAYDNQKSKLNSLITEYNQAKQDSIQQQVMVSQLEDANSLLKLKIVEIQNKLATTDKESHEQLQQISHLRDQIKAQSLQYGHAVEESQQLKTKLQCIEQEQIERSQQISNLQVENSQLNDQYTNSSREIAELNQSVSQYSKLVEEKQELQTIVSKAQEQIEQKCTEIVELETQISNLKIQHNLALEEAKIMQKESLTNQKLLETKSTMIDSQQHEIKQFQSQLSDAQELMNVQCQNPVNQSPAEVQSHNDQDKELESMRATIQSLEAQIHELQERIPQMNNLDLQDSVEIQKLEQDNKLLASAENLKIEEINSQYNKIVKEQQEQFAQYQANIKTLLHKHHKELKLIKDQLNYFRTQLSEIRSLNVRQIQYQVQDQIMQKVESAIYDLVHQQKNKSKQQGQTQLDKLTKLKQQVNQLKQITYQKLDFNLIKGDFESQIHQYITQILMDHQQYHQQEFDQLHNLIDDLKLQNQQIKVQSQEDLLAQQVIQSQLKSENQKINQEIEILKLESQKYHKLEEQITQMTLNEESQSKIYQQKTTKIKKALSQIRADVRQLMKLKNSLYPNQNPLISDIDKEQKLAFFDSLVETLKQNLVPEAPSLNFSQLSQINAQDINQFVENSGINNATIINQDAQEGTIHSAHSKSGQYIMPPSLFMPPRDNSYTKMADLQYDNEQLKQKINELLENVQDYEVNEPKLMKQITLLKNEVSDLSNQLVKIKLMQEKDIIGPQNLQLQQLIVQCFSAVASKYLSCNVRSPEAAQYAGVLMHMLNFSDQNKNRLMDTIRTLQLMTPGRKGLA